MKIYISGPITNNPRYKEQFAEAAVKIKELGHEPINPVNLQCVLDPLTTSWDEYMTVCIPLLSICQGIYMLDGWQSSKGAVQEFWQAWANDLRIFRRLEEVSICGTSAI